MKISQNSTLSLYNSLRHSVSNLQRDLTKLQHEATTGRYADAGLEIGSLNGKRVSLVHDIDRLETISDTNGLINARLEMSITATGSINDAGQDLLSALTASVGQTFSGNQTAQAGKTAVSAISSLLNTTFNGESIFGGINSGEKPISDFENGGPKAAVEAAFQAHFGFSKNDPLAGSIDTAAMSNFLDNVLSDTFTGPDWGTSFSNASDDVINARIGLQETMDTSVSANETGFRQVMYAAVIASEFFDGALSGEAQSVAAEKAISLVGQSSGELANLQGRMGFVANRVEQATQRMQVQIDELTVQSDDLVSVDAYEAATRLQSLITQIEASYTLTGRIQQISLMSYIR